MADARAVPKVHDGLVEPSSYTNAVELAIVRLYKPYLSAAGEAPAMRDVYIMPNVDVDTTTTGALTGYAAVVDGAAPAYGVVTAALGSGTSWMRVVAADAKNALAVPESKAAATLPSASSRAGLVVGDDYPGEVRYAVVHGNDEREARAFAALVRKSRATLDDVVDDTGRLVEGYRTVLRKGSEARARVLSEYMAAHALVPDPEAPARIDVVNTHIERNDPLTQASAGTRAPGSKRMYVVYADAANQHSAHAGVMMYRGPIAGYVLVEGPQGTAKGTVSRAWSNATDARPFSVLPTDTGAYKGSESRRVPDRHANTSARVRAAHNERVCWAGAVRSYNPASERVYHSLDDPHFARTLRELGASVENKVTKLVLETASMQLPALETRDMPLEQLVAVAEHATEERLPVATASFVGMLKEYAHAHTLNLADVFAHQSGDVIAVQSSLLADMAANRSGATDACFSSASSSSSGEEEGEAEGQQ